MARCVSGRRQGCWKGAIAVEQTGDLLDIDLLLPPPQQGGRAPSQRAAPSSVGCPPPRRDSGMRHGALDLPGPQPSEQSKDIQERFLVFISIVFQPAAQKGRSQKVTPSSLLSPQSPDVWAMILLMCV